jgi:hypothetical protein
MALAMAIKTIFTSPDFPDLCFGLFFFGLSGCFFKSVHSTVLPLTIS